MAQTSVTGVRKLPVGREEAAESLVPAGSDDALQEASIGRILVDAKRLAASDIERVLEAAERDKVRFGEAALRLGLVQKKDVDFALARQFAFPCLSPGESAISQDIIAAYSPNHPCVEQLRALRAQIGARISDDPNARVGVAVVSPARGDGRSFTAANLAVLFAQLGRPTLLLDASLRSASAHRLFGVGNRSGLTTLLAGRSGLECLKAVKDVPRLHVLPAGPAAPNPLELLERARFRELLQDLQRRFEVVIVDTPAGSWGGDAPLLARLIGASLIVARGSRTRFADARSFALKLEQARTRVLGVVFNERP